MAKDIILVNDEKVFRAKDIIALVTGKRAPQKASDRERLEKWTEILSTEKIDPKAEGTVQWIYEKLGGLVRTHEEQEKAEKVAEKMKAKNKKKRKK